MRLLRNRQRSHPEKLHSSGVGQEGQDYRACIQSIRRLHDQRIGKVVRRPAGLISHHGGDRGRAWGWKVSRWCILRREVCFQRRTGRRLLQKKRVNMVRPERFELPTYCSGGNRSIHLSYGRTGMDLSVYREPRPVEARTGSAVRDLPALWAGLPCAELRLPAVSASSAPATTLHHDRAVRRHAAATARSTLGRASFTFRVRPPTWLPLRAAMAFSPSSALAISTNPKPRERPVSRSVMMLTRSTCPYAWKS